MLYGHAKAAGLDALFDDREERPGEVQRCGSDRHSVPHHSWQEAPQGIVEVVERGPGRRLTYLRARPWSSFVDGFMAADWGENPF